MDKQKTVKPHVNIGAIGYVDCGKTTLTVAISNYLMDKGCLDFENLCIENPNEFHDIDRYQDHAEQPCPNIMIKTKRFNRSHRNRKK